MSDTLNLWTAYIDGSAKPNPGRMRMGGIIYRPDGSAWSFSEVIAHVGCNNEAEARAALHTLQWLRSQGAQNVQLYTDSSILQEQLAQAHPKPIVRLGTLYAAVRALQSCFDCVQVQWIPRHKNTIADALARGDHPALSAI